MVGRDLALRPGKSKGESSERKLLRKRPDSFAGTSTELQSQDTKDDQSCTNEAEWGGWVTMKGDSEQNRAHRTDPSPYGVSGADWQCACRNAKQSDTDEQGDDGNNGRA